MNVEKFKEYDEKTIAYEWIASYPTGAYEFILELISDIDTLKEQNQLLKESNALAAKLLGLKYKPK